MKDLETIKKALINEFNSIMDIKSGLNTDTDAGLERWEALSHYSNGLRFALDLIEAAQDEIKTIRKE